jgi:uncharacterized membrane protein YciS (DUF1049 family)
MVEVAKGWIKENSTLVTFLVAQLFAMGAGAAWIIAYSVKLDTRVEIMETRGAEYSVARMAKMEERITIIEQRQARNEDQIKRLVDEFIKDTQQRARQPQPQAPR